MGNGKTARGLYGAGDVHAEGSMTELLAFDLLDAAQERCTRTQKAKQFAKNKLNTKGYLSYPVAA